MLLGKWPLKGFSYKKPGACHKARFMAFCLHCMKMLLFARQRQLPAEVLEGLVRLCIFFVTIYIPYFLTAMVGADAAFNDLQLFKSLYSYIDLDGPLAVESLEV